VRTVGFSADGHGRAVPARCSGLTWAARSGACGSVRRVELTVPRALSESITEGISRRRVGAAPGGVAQLDERDPLTLRTAHLVGAILRHVPPDAQIATRLLHVGRPMP